MVTAIVLVKADIQRIPEVAEKVAEITGVSEVYSVTGEFDLVAMVRVRGHDELADVIPGQLNKVPGVTATETHISEKTPTKYCTPILVGRLTNSLLATRLLQPRDQAVFRVLSTNVPGQHGRLPADKRLLSGKQRRIL